MRKKIVYPFVLLIMLCMINIKAHAQSFGTEQFPCWTCDSPTDPCTICNDPNNPPLNLGLQETPPPPDPNDPPMPTPPPQPTGPCTANPCLCSTTGCAVTPSPASCQKYPCQCNPAACSNYNGTTPNPQLPQASVTVTPTLSPAGPTAEYVQATVPAGAFFSWGAFGVIFSINPQNNTLNAATGGGTTDNPWNVNSWIAGNGPTYSQAVVFSSNASGIIAFTIICQLTPNGSSVPNTQSINVQYVLSTNSCIITEN